LGLGAFFLSEGPWNWILAGILMGAAIQFRYQDALMVAGFLGYLLYTGDRRGAIRMVLLLLLMTGLGVCIDSWGYGRWTFVPYNYFRANILEGRANDFSRDPIWF